ACTTKLQTSSNSAWVSLSSLAALASSARPASACKVAMGDRLRAGQSASEREKRTGKSEICFRFCSAPRRHLARVEEPPSAELLAYRRIAHRALAQAGLRKP